MNTTFTEQQVQDYLDKRLRHIERSAVAFQKFNINVVLKDGKPVKDLDFNSFEDIEDESIDITVNVNYNNPHDYSDVFQFRNITDEELSQKIIDAFVEAGLPESDEKVFNIMKDLEYMYNQPDTAVVLMNNGVVEQIVTSKKIQVLVLDNDLEGLTPIELEESGVTVKGQDYYVPNVHTIVDPNFTVDIHNKANKL